LLHNQLIIISLVVLVPSHIDRSLTENLTLHVDSVFSDESVSSLATSDAALTGSLSVVLGMGSVKLIWLSCLGHFIYISGAQERRGGRL
jgi:hypothetical protein